MNLQSENAALDLWDICDNRQLDHWLLRTHGCILQRPPINLTTQIAYHNELWNNGSQGHICQPNLMFTTYLLKASLRFSEPQTLGRSCRLIKEEKKKRRYRWSLRVPKLPQQGSMKSAPRAGRTWPLLTSWSLPRDRPLPRTLPCLANVQQHPKRKAKQTL